MDTFMDFGMLPPEINSGRLYAGVGSAPLLTAAAAWTGLAADLRSTSADYSSTVAGLTSGAWQGPASTSMAAAASSYTAWLNTTAAQAEETATAATAAAGAYETARAATVPPPVVTANRAQLASLVATNVLGQNTPAIAATEAEYGQMWAQDAAAMYGYAGSSAAATKVTSFAAPQQTTNPGGLAGQAAAVTQATGTSASTNTQNVLSQLTSAVPSTLQGMASPAASTSSSTAGLTGILDTLSGNGSGGTAQIFNDIFSPTGLGLNSTFWNTIFSSGFYTPANTFGSFLSLIGSGGGAEAASAAAGDAALGELGAGLGAPLTGPLSGLGGIGGLGGLGNGVSAGLGRAASLGPLSVPPSWTPIAPAASPIGSALGGTPLTGPAGATSAVPGGIAPAAGLTGRTTGQLALPDTRFLDRPPMVPSWAAVG